VVVDVGAPCGFGWVADNAQKVVYVAIVVEFAVVEYLPSSPGNMSA